MHAYTYTQRNVLEFYGPLQDWTLIMDPIVLLGTTQSNTISVAKTSGHQRHKTLAQFHGAGKNKSCIIMGMPMIIGMFPLVSMR